MTGTSPEQGGSKLRVIPVATVTFIIVLVTYSAFTTGKLTGPILPTQTTPLPLVPFAFAFLGATIIVLVSWTVARLPPWKVAVTTGDVPDEWEEVDDE